MCCRIVGALCNIEQLFTFPHFHDLANVRKCLVGTKSGVEVILSLHELRLQCVSVGLVWGLFSVKRKKKQHNPEAR